MSCSSSKIHVKMIAQNYNIFKDVPVIDDLNITNEQINKLVKEHFSKLENKGKTMYDISYEKSSTFAGNVLYLKYKVK